MERKGERGRFTLQRFADKMNFYSYVQGFDIHIHTWGGAG
jgi:hypothetical protein